MMVARGLRLTAVAIALGGVADPAFTREQQVPRPVSIVVINGADMDKRGWASAERLRSSLARGYDASVRAHPSTAAASACPADGGCIVITDGARPRQWTSGADVIGAVRVGVPRSRNVVIERITTPGRVKLHGAASMTVHLRAVGARETIDVKVLDGGVLVGMGTSASMEDPLVAPINIDWIPLAAGPRMLRVVATALEGGETVANNEADIGVDVITDAAPVLMYEPEPTWLGTFVRRVVAADPRLRLDARTRLAPGVTVARDTSTVLTATILSGVEAAIVSAPESLTQAEVELLDRFVRMRGGSLILLPDRRPSGPVTQLFPPITAERRETEPQGVGLLRASELLTFDGSRAGVTVLESTGGHPVIVSRAMGRGRVVASGALDAWRFRGGSESFGQFWSSLVADAVNAAGAALSVTLSEAVIAPGDETGVTVEWRSLDGPLSEVTARAEIVCDDGQTLGATKVTPSESATGATDVTPSESVPVRLWPTGRVGVFTGTVSALSPGACEVRAAIPTASSLTATAGLMVAESLRRPVGDLRALDGAIAAHGGSIVDAGDEATLVARVREQLPSQTEPREERPMRLPWWIVPFAACLGGEWWLRRRRGLS